MGIDRTEAARELAKAIANHNAGMDAAANEWATRLVNRLKAAGIWNGGF